MSLSEREAIAKYLGAMPGPPERPRRDHDPIRARGAAIFASAETGCAGCHGLNGDDPDGVSHDVIAGTRNDLSRRYDTPSLKFLGGTAPYFHDGRFADLASLLAATDGKMGKTSHLSGDDRVALETFLGSL